MNSSGLYCAYELSTSIAVIHACLRQTLMKVKQTTGVSRNEGKRAAQPGRPVLCPVLKYATSVANPATLKTHVREPLWIIMPTPAHKSKKDTNTHPTYKVARTTYARVSTISETTEIATLPYSISCIIFVFLLLL